VTGDIANGGQENEYSQATNFFDELLEATGLSKKQLFVVPGNHDVDRPSGRWLIRSLSTAHESDVYFSQDGELSHIRQKMGSFNNWFNDYFSNVRHFSTTSPFSDIEVADIRGLKVGILLVNTGVFSQDDHDNGKLWLGRRPLDDAVQALQSAGVDLRIALMHHPLEWLSEIERPNISSVMRREFDCLLTGHLHQNDVLDVEGISGSCLHLAAGASYQGAEWPNRALFAALHGADLYLHPIRYEDGPQEVWTLDPSLFPDAEGYEGRFYIQSLDSEASEAPLPPSHSDGLVVVATESQLPSANPTKQEEARKEFFKDLFVSPAGSVISVDPRLMIHPQDQSFEESTPNKVELQEIIDDGRSYIVEARSEYGGTTLCKRLYWEFSKREDTSVFIKDARTIPNYKKKLLGEFEGERAKHNILILDNFDHSRDERLLKEIISLDIFDRTIIISPIRGIETSGLSTISSDFKNLSHLYLWSLSRSDVRSMAASFFDSNDDDFTSIVVNKIYADLLALCIPLTPSNVIMYLKVLHRENDFYPLNRVDIVERYIGETLRRSSDVYQGSFNSKTKMDIVSAFVYRLFDESLGIFSQKHWYDFCENYCSEALISFNAKTLLDELVSSRLVVEIAHGYRLKYGFFYAFFLGRYIAARATLLEDFIESGDCGRVSGAVEVVSGLNSDNTRLVEILTDRLEGYVDQFFARYVKRDFDPFITAQWVDSDSEEEKTWAPVNKQIEEGPKKPDEIDNLKQSLMSEARTSQQEVKFQELVDLEYELFKTADHLLDAIKNSDNIAGELKKRAILLISDTRMIVVQVGALLSPVIAQRRWTRWGGIGFLNCSPVDREDEKKYVTSVQWILEQLSDIVAKQSSEQLGTRNLGEVFKAIENDASVLGFRRFLNFWCILRSKPNNWSESLGDIIRATDRREFYLAAMLDALLDEYAIEVNQGRDRQSLKELVALIRTKREIKTNDPGAKIVSRMLAHLEKIRHFDKFSTRQEGADGENT
jgi:predicted phosphodiesterase